jgi:enediyne biosynthesis protein E4
MKFFLPIYVFLSIVALTNCKSKDMSIGDEITKVFSLTDNNKTGLKFKNDLPFTEEFNTYTYRNFYNGGGVATGDVNNDGLLDVYVTGNISDNKLFLNKGNWQFEDITQKAGVACKNVWSTGASMVDVNGDGLLDIYVCKGGKPGGANRHNELFINNGDLTFTEKSKEYGLDITGLSIHAAFLDYDKDGDLDCYVLNNSMRSVGGFDLKEDLRNVPSNEGNKFLKNENGRFVDITTKSGIYSSAIGYGLGITISDFNNDNWSDLFISNDFFERDYLYINNAKGGFEEVGDKYFSSMSMGSMGADAADLDNDLRTDLFVTEMLPSTHERRKTKNIYESWDKHNEAVVKGYHYQYSRNVVQKNTGDGRFYELSRFAGVAATDWSWAALIQDFDNDGLKDIFVSNGQYKDLLDRDYLNFSADQSRIRQGILDKRNVIMELIDSMPSEPVKNCMFQNKGDFQFENTTEAWGLGTPSFSNGSAYGDLDNDGDLDLLINNANMDLFVYKNNTDTSTHRSIQIQLSGIDKNTKAIGAKLILKTKEESLMIENYSSRGFESSVADKLTIGVGNTKTVDSLIILWPNDKISIATNLSTNNHHQFDQKLAMKGSYNIVNSEVQYAENQFETFVHKEHDVNLFSKERMLIEMNGFDGPALAVADVNDDGVDDVFCGGGRNQVSELYVSDKQQFKKITAPFMEDLGSEKVKAVFFDSDGDNDKDLYVAHGGKLFSAYSFELNDALYINDGKGNFTKKKDFTNFPYQISTNDIVIGDLNKDGKNDIVIAEKYKVDFYGEPTNISILYNKGNNTYTFSTPRFLKNVSLSSALALGDLNNDGWLDIVAGGKWAPISILINNKGTFENTKLSIIEKTEGLWNTITTYDYDNDGDLDILGGNEGINSFLRPGCRLYIGDFDDNGVEEQITCDKIGSKYFPIHDNDELFSQLPSLKKKFLYHRQLAKASMDELFSKVILDKVKFYDINELRSGVLLNDKGKYTFTPFQNEIQYSSVHALYCDESGIYLGGNTYKVKPQFGRQDASKGWVIPKGSKPLSLNTDGEIRGIKKYNNNLLIALNNIGIKQLNKK